MFDLLYGGDATELGTDTLAGYNVNAIALQLPKNVLAINGNATAQPGHRRLEHDRPAQRRGRRRRRHPDNQFVQVSRLGNPLVNEVVVPLSLKDAFNSISPDVGRQRPSRRRQGRSTRSCRS